jgi:hypothetical protein
MYCKKNFTGNATAAAKHLTGSSCKIPFEAAITLMDKIDECSDRRSEKLSNAKGRKVKKGNKPLLRPSYYVYMGIWFCALTIDSCFLV